MQPPAPSPCHRRPCVPSAAVVRRYSQLEFEALPATSESRPPQARLALAAAAFDAPQFLSGAVRFGAALPRRRCSPARCHAMPSLLLLPVVLPVLVRACS